ncbi:hypothetical protein A7K91_19265 [Paenibacillus oryzae]|uniref:Uncharacterized protein n=2 Tax=Paenibacillus oryzae TaxID=1844972 RepID=A0A1A5YP27_9BACL|nr:hypothetical protein A7K91_19265 [Paenibacillus oryzae]
MGLAPMAEKEEVEKRYTTLLKRERARQKQSASESASSEGRDEPEFTKITEAYRYILEYEDRKITEAFNQQEYGKYGGMAEKAQKVDHFWRYYKFHTLGAIALIALLIYGINSYIDHREHQKYLASLPPVDVHVSFFGTFMLPEGQKDQTAVNAALLSHFPEWQRVDSTITFVPQDDMNQMAYLQKAAVTLVTEKADVYIMDRSMLQYIGTQGVLMELDDKTDIIKGLDEKRLQKLTVTPGVLDETPGEEHIYAIDLSGSWLDKELPLLKMDLFAGVRVNSENPEKALQFIKTFASAIK